MVALPPVHDLRLPEVQGLGSMAHYGCCKSKRASLYSSGKNCEWETNLRSTFSLNDSKLVCLAYFAAGSSVINSRLKGLTIIRVLLLCEKYLATQLRKTPTLFENPTSENK